MGKRADHRWVRLGARCESGEDRDDAEEKDGCERFSFCQEAPKIQEFRQLLDKKERTIGEVPCTIRGVENINTAAEVIALGISDAILSL